MAGISPRLAAMNLLARREHSLWELRQKLSSRDYPAEELEQVLMQLRDEGLQSDGRYIESFIQGRVNKGQGPLKIRYELQQRGIEPELTQQHLDHLEVDWPTLAEQVRCKRFGEDPPHDYAERAKQMRFLQSRGFSHELMPTSLTR